MTKTALFLSIAFLLGTIKDLSAELSKEKFDYWVWAGQSVESLPNEATLYLHQGTIEESPNGSLVFRKQGLGPILLHNSRIFIVYRLETLVDPEIVVKKFESDLDLWELRGCNIVGIQIDYDSPSLKLKRYVEFLSKLRTQTPSKYEISITGLVDWVISAKKEDLSELQNITNEVVFQLYDYKREVPILDLYVSPLNSLSKPFKLGIMPNQKRRVSDLRSRLNRLKNFVIFRD